MKDSLHRLVVGISGASGVIYGIRILEILRDIEEVETHLILTNAAKQTIGMETDFSSGEIEKLADCSYPIKDISAGPASGTFPCDGMIVAPCSIRTLSAVANSHSSDLLTRTADVTLKEKRPLILMVRETPFHLGHLCLTTIISHVINNFLVFCSNKNFSNIGFYSFFINMRNYRNTIYFKQRFTR